MAQEILVETTTATPKGSRRKEFEKLFPTCDCGCRRLVCPRCGKVGTPFFQKNRIITFVHRGEECYSYCYLGRDYSTK
jgi:hypothetical protein